MSTPFSLVPGPPRPDPPLHEADDRDVSTSTRTWPRTLVPSLVLTALLLAVIAGPIVVSGPSSEQLVVGLVLVPIGVMATRLSFDSRLLRRHGRLSFSALLPTVPAAAVGTAIGVLTCFVSGSDVSVPFIVVTYVLLVAVLGLAAYVRSLELSYQLATRRVYFVGSALQHRDVRSEVRHTGDMTLVGHLTVDPAMPIEVDERQLAEAIQRAGATVLVLAGEVTRNGPICAAAASVNRRGVRVRPLTAFYERGFRKVPLSELTPSWFLFDIAEVHRPRLYGIAKRFAESAIALITLLAVAPVLAVAMAATKLTDPGPVFYRQQRVGRDDLPFTILKIRTMRAAADQQARWAGAEQQRITPVGAVLRRFRIDEVPQLYNVLRGDLSLVGPRPEQVPMVEQLEAKIPYYRARHHVRPGLTGWAQVNHGYGGSDDGTLEKLQYDFFYVKHQSLRLDLLVVLMTAQAILRGPDA